MNTLHDSERRNFRIQILEGALYIGSGALLSAQTVYPVLLTRLGAGNIAVGILPVLVFAFFFLPQVIAANYVGRFPFRKPWVLASGIVQRFHIAALAVLIIAAGPNPSPWVLPLFFLIFVSNQMSAGIASPAWFDFVIKTTPINRRGILLGLRTSFGSLIGFANGLVLAFLLATLPYPWSYGVVIFLGFVFQLASWFVQRSVAEITPSPLKPGVPLNQLARKIRSTLRTNKTFVRFLTATSFIVLGFSGVAFFTVSALKTLELKESIIGIFTILTIGAQIVSGATLGWIADRRGNKITLIVTATSLLLALVCAAFARSAGWYYAVFLFTGLNLGAELMARYNFTAECSGDDERPLYLGMMNAWCAPWYLGSLLGGWVSDQFGYTTFYVACAVSTAIGIALLFRLPNPRRAHLAVSSK
jgi:MFS family permease